MELGSYSPDLGKTEKSLLSSIVQEILPDLASPTRNKSQHTVGTLRVFLFAEQGLPLVHESREAANSLWSWATSSPESHGPELQPTQQ